MYFTCPHGPLQYDDKVMHEQVGELRSAHFHHPPHYWITMCACAAKCGICACIRCFVLFWMQQFWHGIICLYHLICKLFQAHCKYDGVPLIAYPHHPLQHEMEYHECTANIYTDVFNACKFFSLNELKVIMLTASIMASAPGFQCS